MIVYDKNGKPKTLRQVEREAAWLKKNAGKRMIDCNCADGAPPMQNCPACHGTGRRVAAVLGLRPHGAGQNERGSE